MLAIALIIVSHKYSSHSVKLAFFFSALFVLYLCKCDYVEYRIANKHSYIDKWMHILNKITKNTNCIDI